MFLATKKIFEKKIKKDNHGRKIKLKNKKNKLKSQSIVTLLVLCHK
jgi:hypothetical protein